MFNEESLEGYIVSTQLRSNVSAYNVHSFQLRNLSTKECSWQNSVQESSTQSKGATS